MDSIVEENGNSNNVDGMNAGSASEVNNLSQQQQQSSSSNSAPPPTHPSSSSTVLTTTGNVVQYLPAAQSIQLQVQSVIQAANQSSVIQTAATNAPPIAISKGGVVYVAKPNSTVIHTTSGNAVQLPPNFPCKIKPEPNSQHPDSNSDDSLSDEDSPRRRRELTRRPSYHKIFNDISGPDISAGATLQMQDAAGLPTLGTPGSTSGTLIHMPQDSASAFYIPNNSVIAEDQTRKREIRLQKNREAARECRRKKKEYIKCLENRVAVLENQNKALIEELKSLKELYCQTKID